MPSHFPIIQKFLDVHLEVHSVLTSGASRDRCTQVAGILVQELLEIPGFTWVMVDPYLRLASKSTATRTNLTGGASVQLFHAGWIADTDQLLKEVLSTAQEEHTPRMQPVGTHLNYPVPILNKFFQLHREIHSVIMSKEDPHSTVQLARSLVRKLLEVRGFTWTMVDPCLRVASELTAKRTDLADNRSVRATHPGCVADTDELLKKLLDDAKTDPTTASRMKERTVKVHDANRSIADKRNGWTLEALRAPVLVLCNSLSEASDLTEGWYHVQVFPMATCVQFVNLLLSYQGRCPETILLAGVTRGAETKTAGRVRGGFDSATLEDVVKAAERLSGDVRVSA